jgi:hypothetical protein
MSKGTLLKKASLKQLEQEVSKRRTKKVKELEEKKQRIEAEIRDLNGNIIETIIEPKVSGAKTLKKSMRKNAPVVVIDEPLKERLVRLARDGGIKTTKYLLSTLEAEGWKSTSARPYYVVAAAMASLEKKNVFRRITKGSYQLVTEG